MAQNGGEVTHDMLSGPCECGAWHNPLEKEWEHMNPEQNVSNGEHPNIWKETARCSDADLKHLKDYVNCCGLHPCKETDRLSVTRSVLRAFLTRLETAELALMTECACDPTIHPNVCKETVAWNKWRAVTGK